ncbi:MAG: nuclear transport factor 2 family protein [Pseudomonadota bacterium]
MTSISLSERSDIERACERLIYLSTYLNDERKFDELVEMFTEDAQLIRPNSPGQPLTGHDAIRAAYKSRPAGVLTFHNCSDVVVTVESATTATARSKMLVLIAGKKEGGTEPDAASVKGPTAAIFHDSFVLTAQGWKFAKRQGAFWAKP